MKKRMISAFTCAALTLSLSACAGKSSSSDAGSESQSSQETTTTTAPVVTLAPEKTTVINPEPVTYESLGVDSKKKDSFKEKMTKAHTLPIINMTTAPDDEIVSIDDYTSCVIDVFNCDSSQEINAASAGVKVRGNSSAFYGDVAQIRRNQVPYRIKFDEKTNMLGLNDGAECKSWVLLKADWDLIRNDIAFRFGRAIMEPDGYYCSDSRHVLVYVNDEFKGVYLLCEQCQINKNRVDVSQPEEGYTGNDIGYYLELDNYATSDEDNHYITLDYGEYEVTDIEGETRAFVPAEYSVKNDLYTQGQIDFIDKYLNGVFEIVYQACEKGKYLTFDENYELVDAEYNSAEETVSAVMDIKSVVDMYLLYEIVHDYDCGEGSFFMCVDFSEGSTHPKLTFTSPWDFNWAYNDSISRYWAAAFCEESFAKSKGDRSNPWFILLMKQDWFADLAKEKWTSMKSDKLIESCVEEEKTLLDKDKEDLCMTDEWAVDSAAQLFKWIEGRIKWMDKKFVKE
ncbi:MAG: CotH kinase family protein [Ruminococcus sp.]|nr:CotH kinase family protein [Ruminococcus sp.]